MMGRKAFSRVCLALSLCLCALLTLGPVLGLWGKKPYAYGGDGVPLSPTLYLYNDLATSVVRTSTTPRPSIAPISLNEVWVAANGKLYIYAENVWEDRTDTLPWQYPQYSKQVAAVEYLSAGTNAGKVLAVGANSNGSGRWVQFFLYTPSSNSWERVGEFYSGIGDNFVPKFVLYFPENAPDTIFAVPTTTQVLFLSSNGGSAWTSLSVVWSDPSKLYPLIGGYVFSSTEAHFINQYGYCWRWMGGVALTLELPRLATTQGSYTSGAYNTNAGQHYLYFGTSDGYFDQKIGGNEWGWEYKPLLKDVVTELKLDTSAGEQLVFAHYNTNASEPQITRFSSLNVLQVNPVEQINLRTVLGTPNQIPLWDLERDALRGIWMLGETYYDASDRLALIKVLNTLPGTNVSVPLPEELGVAMVFDQVTARGDTLIQATDDIPPLPERTRALSGETYQITTTAAYQGEIELQIDYNENNLPVEEEELKLLHHNGTQWEDITTEINTSENYIMGRTSSLSPFAVAYGEGAEAVTDMEIWAHVEKSLLTRLESCETFGTIPAGTTSYLDTNIGSGDVYNRTYDSVDYPSTVDSDPADNTEAIANLADWGPGVVDGDGTLWRTDKIDYNVSGNVSFDTKVYANGDFTQVNGTDAIPAANRLSIEELIGPSSFITFAGTGLANAIQVLDAEDPTSAGDAGIAYGFNLGLDVPDDTLPGLYHTTLTFVTYQE